MNDFLYAAWPVIAALAALAALWALWRSFLSRSCWRCKTPLELYRRKHPLSRFALITRCDRCGCLRGCILR